MSYVLKPHQKDFLACLTANERLTNRLDWYMMTTYPTRNGVI